MEAPTNIAKQEESLYAFFKDLKKHLYAEEIFFRVGKEKELAANAAGNRRSTIERIGMNYGYLFYNAYFLFEKTESLNKFFMELRKADEDQVNQKIKFSFPDENIGKLNSLTMLVCEIKLTIDGTP